MDGAMMALGDAAVELPWLVPGSAALVALTRAGDAAPCQEIRSDPGALLLVLRATSQETFTSFAGLAARPDVLQSARQFLNNPCHPFVDWNRVGPNIVYCKCLELATLTRAVADGVPGCDPERAWIAGMLAPLGWLAVAAAAPADMAGFLEEFKRAGHQPGWQEETWGLDHVALVRRLTRRWRLPGWLTAVLDNLSVSVEAAELLGAEVLLFQAVQLAVILDQQQDRGLGLRVGAESAELLRNLRLDSRAVEDIVQTARLHVPTAPLVWQAPAQTPLLDDLLRLAWEKCQVTELGHRRDLHTDRLHGALDAQCAGEKARLFKLKMSALAEVAAGAGHEINNPLAVISGQAQYVLRQLEQLECLAVEESSLTPLVEELQTKIHRSLGTIVSQSQRIHQVLVELMQFAKPSSPRPQMLSVATLLDDAAETLREAARARGVRLICSPGPTDWQVLVDPGQIRIALLGLLRNAIEAASAEGWAGVRVEQNAERTVRVIVEDNGPGPSASAREHLFDPFFSGRAAGRGRGLGLPTAWRLARQQGGDLCFEGHVQGITRFVLILPGVAPSGVAPSGDIAECGGYRLAHVSNGHSHQGGPAEPVCSLGVD